MKECAFCPRPAVRKGGEHLWSAWMSRSFPYKKYRLRRYDYDKDSSNQWVSKSVNWKAPVVCEQCNNGWMSELESNHALPAMRDLILADRLTSLKPERIKSIANFAFKTAVVADHIDLDDGSPFFTLAARRAFAASLAIPRGVQMWLSAFKEEGQGIARTVYHNSPAKATVGYQFYALTFGAGFLLFQVVATRWLSARLGGHPGLTQGNFWNKFSIPLWPHDGSTISWPPDKQLTLRLASQYVNRWNDVNVPKSWV